ncbi:hypothetical protein V6M85_13965 (plasmid) [Sulfolobus tengchongensis]|uniref:Uncharacterized protein n=1 Tax=Sulfolobus tengchongensis TaxID=207809 RepID=A0AAX4L481_9CREN
MKVTIDYKTLTDYAYRNCLCDKNEWGEYDVSECTHDGEFEVDVQNAEFDYEDLKELVDRYEDEIREILEREERKEERKKEKKQVIQQKTLENWMG